MLTLMIVNVITCPPATIMPVPDDTHAIVQSIRDMGGECEANTAGEIVRVSFHGSKRVTDAGLSVLAQLQDLESLSLYATDITDDGLKELMSLRNLRSVETVSKPV